MFYLLKDLVFCLFVNCVIQGSKFNKIEVVLQKCCSAQSLSL